MACLHFSDHLNHDALPPAVVEDAFRFYGNFAGIHSFSFDSTIDETFASLDDWAVGGGYWEVSSGAVYATGTGSGWQALFYSGSADIPADFKLSVRKTGDRGGIVFRGDDTQNYYLLYWTSTSMAFAKVADGSVNDLSVLPTPYSGEADIELAVREVRYSDSYTGDHFLTMTVLVDGRTVLTAADCLEGDSPGDILGLAVYDTDTLSSSDSRIPQLTQYVYWCSVDPNETPMGGLRRAIKGRYILYFARWDGTLRVWAPGEQELVATLTDSDLGRRSLVRDYRKLATHIRMLGAAMAEGFDDEERYVKYGHRFMEVNYPTLDDEDECYEEGQRMLKRIRAESRRIAFEIDGHVLLEYGDRVRIGDTDYVLDQFSSTLTANRIQRNISGREYIP